jgi:hypothetical protein
MYVATPLRAIFDDEKTPAKRVVWQNKATGKLVVKLVKPNRYVDIPTSARVLGSGSSRGGGTKEGGKEEEDFETALLRKVKHHRIGPTFLRLFGRSNFDARVINSNSPKALHALKRQLRYALYEYPEYKEWLTADKYTGEQGYVNLSMASAYNRGFLNL